MEENEFKMRTRDVVQVNGSHRPLSCTRGKIYGWSISRMFLSAHTYHTVGLFVVPVLRKSWDTMSVLVYGI